MISIVAAVADNGAIGKDNQLLWHITEDLRYFRKLTTGHTVIMGRKTWESIGKPLPNRRNIVVSKSLSAADLKIVNGSVEIYPSLEAALSASENEVFIIGGGEIYSQAIPFADKLYLTRVHICVEDADTFFPGVNFSEWREVSRNYFPRGEVFGFPFEFVVLVRR